MPLGWPTSSSDRDAIGTRSVRRGVARLAAGEGDHAGTVALDWGVQGAGRLEPQSGSGSGRGRRTVWEWRLAKEGRSPQQIHALSEATSVFPATRYPPSSSSDSSAASPGLSAFRLAQQGLHFLQSRHSEDHIPFDLIRDELAASRIAETSYDPFAGNCIAAAGQLRRGVAASCVLAWPMGVNGQELNVSPFVHQRRWEQSCDGTRSRYVTLTLTPSPRPSFTFPTPIQQITAGPPSSDTSRSALAGIHLAVRTVDRVAFLALEAGKADAAGPPAAAREIYRLRREELGGRRAVDVGWDPRGKKRALVVDDAGGLYRWDLNTAAWREPIKFSNIRQASSAEALDYTRRFHRVAFPSDPSCALITSDKLVRQVDFRSRKADLPLYELPEHSSTYITALEGSSRAGGADHLTVVATTENVAWIDERNTKEPVLTWRHHREFDRTLDVRTVMLGGDFTTLLFSRANPLITAYSASPSPLHLHAPTSPYLIPASPTAAPRAGLALFQHPNQPAALSDELELFELSETGALSRRVFGLDVREDDEEQEREVGRAYALGKVKEVDDLRIEGREEDGWFESGRAAAEVDLRAVRDEMVDPGPAPDPTPVLENLPTLFQQLHAPPATILTGHDAALLACPPPPSPPSSHLADFLSPSLPLLPTSSLPTLDPSQSAGYSASLAPYLASFFPHIPPDLASAAHTAAALRALYNVASPAASPEEAAACDILSADLALASQIYAAEPLRRAPPSECAAAMGEEQVDGEQEEDDDPLSRATRGMHIRPRSPPPVHFSFLTPTAPSRPEGSDGAPAQLITPAARLLLSEWTVGSDPSSYVYVDPYAELARPEPEPSRKSTTRRGKVSQSQSLSQPSFAIHSAPMQLPPVVFASQRPARMGAQSQVFRAAGMGMDDSQSQSQSQPATQSQGGPSTQILPGRFGGRRDLGAKGKKKGRTRGF